MLAKYEKDFGQNRKSTIEVDGDNLPHHTGLLSGSMSPAAAGKDAYYTLLLP